MVMLAPVASTERGVSSPVDGAAALEVELGADADVDDSDAESELLEQPARTRVSAAPTTTVADPIFVSFMDAR
ncbi:hypothetical protein GCM10007298_30680 [Williamsia phyllosphaerae]|uniref:Uncharacterized protein n=1 Tax=Williamsia phyllosphaerae TaxID=885042 RepID=A0ABQ1V010_9NOCA|nr:hypothetical protein GCM10007298_30680 [Williamsia phyllosphaerae]